jgi:hypothetical protein
MLNAKKSSAQIVNEIFGNRLQNIPLQQNLTATSIAWIECVMARYNDYNMHAAMKKFCTITAADNAPNRSQELELDAGNSSKKRKRGCRAGKHAREHKKRRTEISLPERSEAIVAVQPSVISLGDRVVKSILRNASADISIGCIDGFYSQDLRSQQQQPAYCSTDQVQRSSKSQRKRIKRKLQAMLQRPQSNLIDQIKPAPAFLLEDVAPKSAGLHLHLHRSHLTFVSHVDC